MADPDFIPDAQQPQDSDFVPDAPKEPNTSAMKSYVKSNIDQHFAAGETEESKAKALEKKQGAATTAKGFFEALEAGYQGSATGLALRKKLPDINLPEHAPTAYKIASQIGALADLPLMAAAGVGGAVAGGAAGTVELPVVGTVAGATVGGGAAAFAVPAAMRKILIDHYEKGDIQDAHDFATRLASTSWEAIKGATTGAVTALTGGATKFAGPIVQGASELAAMTTASAALEGHLPEPSDFVAGAVVIGGLHGVGALKPKLSNWYAATGEKPAEVAKRAEVDVNLKQDLIAGNLNEPIPPVKMGENNQLVSEPVTPKDINPHPEMAPRKGLPELTEAEKEIASKLGTNADPENPTLKEKWQDWYANNIDKNAPLKYAIEAAEERGAAIAPDADAYKAATRFAAWQDRVGTFFEHGTRDFETGEKNGEGLNDIYADVPDKDIERFRYYAMAKRGLELFERGIKPWADFNPETAKQVVDAGQQSYENINQRRVDFKNRVLEYVRKSGLIDEDAEQRMVEANKQAFPFHRVQEPDLFTGKTGGPAILKKIFGSDKKILDPILADYQDTAIMIKKAMINDVRNNFLDNMHKGGLVDDGPGTNLDAYLKRVPDKMAGIAIGSDELASALKKQGIELKADDITVFRPEQGVLKDNQVAFKVDGKRVVYEGPPGVIESLKALDGDGAAMGTWVKFMSAFAKMERVGNTSAPAFGFSHFFRAATMSGVYTKTGQIPFWDAAKVIPDIIGKSDLYRDAEYQGAFSKVFEPINNQFMEKNIEAAGIETNFQQKAWNVVKHPLDAAEAWIKLTDSASRLAEYKGAIEQGRTPEEAASLARNVVVDYQKAGLQKSVIRQTTAFIGVHINSMDQLRLAFVEDPKSTIARLSMISGISAAVWALNKDDEAIQALPAWQKGLFWNLNISGSKDPKQATILRLPKPWAAGIAFGTGVEVALDLAFKDDKNGAANFASTLMGSVIPTPIPNMVSPMIEQGFNKQLTSGRPLVSADKEKLLPELRYETYTSETAKQLSKVIGYVPLVRDIGPNSDPLSSPTVVENYIKGWTGSMGGLALKISDAGLRAVGVGNQHTLPESRLADAPFFDSFISRYPSMKNQNLTDFYANKKKADEEMNSLKFSTKQGDIDLFNRINSQHTDLNLDGIGSAIGKAKQALDNIQFRTDIPPVEKRQLMDTIMYQIGSMAKMGNKMADDYKKELKKKDK